MLMFYPQLLQVPPASGPKGWKCHLCLRTWGNSIHCFSSSSQKLQALSVLTKKHDKKLPGPTIHFQPFSKISLNCKAVLQPLNRLRNWLMFTMGALIWRIHISASLICYLTVMYLCLFTQMILHKINAVLMNPHWACPTKKSQGVPYWGWSLGHKVRPEKFLSSHCMQLSPVSLSFDYPALPEMASVSISK